MATPRKLDFPDVTDPNFDPDVPFEADNGLNYKWNGNAWEVVCGAGTETDGFLLKHGHIVDDAPDTVEYQWNADVQVHIDETNFEVKTTVAGGDYVSIADENDDIYLDAKVDIADVNSRTRTKIQSEGPVSIGSTSNDVTLEASSGAERVNRAIGETDVDEQIVNKRYVDEKEDFLQGEIIELEEEIEGIAITSERGEWISATTANPGEFRMVNLMGQTTQDYNDETINSIFFNNFDAQDPSVEHGWADVEVGNILELLDKPDSDYAIFEITGKNPGATVMSFDVAFIKGVGEATLGDRTRIKIFAKPTGGSLEDYVRIAGDTMTGTLTMGNTLDMPDGADTDSPTVTFRAKNSGGTIRSSTLQVKSGANTLYASGAFRAGGAISAAGNLQYNGSDRIKLANNSSIQELRVGSNVAMQWDSTYGIRGIRAANSWGGNGKYLAYSSSYGLIWETPPSNTTTNYVKTNSTGFSNNLTITKSGGVYYITGG